MEDEFNAQFDTAQGVRVKILNKILFYNHVTYQISWALSVFFSSKRSSAMTVDLKKLEEHLATRSYVEG